VPVTYYLNIIKVYYKYPHLSGDDIMNEITRVCCAIIEDGAKVLAAQRSEEMGRGHKWEFPGGKIEHNETPGECIKRELMEELGIEVEIKSMLNSYTHKYKDKTIELIPFIVEITNGVPTPKEHEKLIWESPECLKDLEWSGADVPVLKEYLTRRE